MDGGQHPALVEGHQLGARLRHSVVDGEVSVGDYVLAGGEVASMVILEAVGRLVPGVMGNDTSADDESFSDGMLEYPQYTRPAEFRGLAVPDVLRSGDHARVARWRRAQALLRTATHRPDLLAARGGLTEADEDLLDEFGLRRSADLAPGNDVALHAAPIGPVSPNAHMRSRL